MTPLEHVMREPLITHQHEAGLLVLSFRTPQLLDHGNNPHSMEVFAESCSKESAL